MKINWEKCASVTHGGKNYFYFAKINGVSYWVLWDRAKEKWTFQGDNNVVLKTFNYKTPKSVMDWIEKNWFFEITVGA